MKAVVAVCDAGGNAVCMQREDDAYIASIDIAVNKAFTSASLKMTTEEVGKLAAPGAPLFSQTQRETKKLRSIASETLPSLRKVPWNILQKLQTGRFLKFPLQS